MPGARRTAGLLEAIADQAAITIRTTRLIDELDRSREALGRRAEAEQALREIAARITILREPEEILNDVVAQAGRLVRADGVILDLLDPSTGNLHWAFDDGLSDIFSAEERAQLWISVGVGATGTAVAENRVILADGDLASYFPPSPESTEFYERTGFHSMIAAPITGDSGPLGRPRGLRKGARGLQRDRCEPGLRAREPGRHRHHQRAAHRCPRPLARGDRPSRRLRTDPARDRGPRLGHPRAGRGPPADRRRDDPTARIRRCTDRPVRPRDRRAALVVRRRRRDGQGPGMGPDRRPQARPGGGRHRLRRAASGAHRRLPHRRTVHPRRHGARLRRRGRASAR